MRNVSGMANLLTGDVTVTLKKQGATYYLYADYPDNVTGEATKLIGSFSGTLDRVFYLTAKASTRREAFAACKKLYDAFG